MVVGFGWEEWVCDDYCFVLNCFVIEIYVVEVEVRFKECVVF